MMPRWLAVLACLCVVVTTGQSAAVPQEPQDTLVATSTSTTVTNGVSSKMISDELTTEMTTEEPNVPIKLIEMDVRSEVSMRYAHTAVVTRMRNAARRAQEATFRLLLPDTAFISGFTMILDGKPYKAYVKGKDEAKEIYRQAVSRGLGAAHIATKARDSNHFTVSVNIEPNTTAVFNLTYEELLVRRNSVYNHAINLHPGALVPKLKITVHIKEGQKITHLRVPEVRTGNEIDANENDTQNSKAVIARSQGDREAVITFDPDINDQLRLMEMYTEKSRDSITHVSKPDGDNMQIVLGQFVVQYDVDRPKGGEILVNGGYFVHFFAPKSLPPLSKHVVFVLDTSGSMAGRKIEQLMEAMKTILGELNPGDYFNIVEFASSVKVHDLKEAAVPESNFYQYWGPATLVPPSPATPENVKKARIIVSRLDPSQSTNIIEALRTAVDLINKGVALPQTQPDNQEISAVAKPENKPVNNEETSQLEPVIIFLTDGQPTVGESSPDRIISIISEKNSGANKASIFSLSFGDSADRDFLRKLSLRNDGFMRNIYAASDAALQLRDFYRQVSSPLLADVQFVYPPDQVETETLTKHQFRTLYAGSEMVVAGRVSGARLLAPQVVARCAVGELDSFRTRRYEVFPRVAMPANTTSSSKEYFPLERLWAYLSIKQLLDERDAALPQSDQENSPEKKALAIALKYEFVTPLTSLVVVKPNETNAIGADPESYGDDYSVPDEKYPAVHMYYPDVDDMLMGKGSALRACHVLPSRMHRLPLLVAQCLAILRYWPLWLVFPVVHAGRIFHHDIE